jgi:hypothetical protein
LVYRDAQKTKENSLIRLKHSVEVFFPPLPKLCNGDHEAERRQQEYWEEVGSRWVAPVVLALRPPLRQKARATMVVFHAACHGLLRDVPGL